MQRLFVRYDLDQSGTINSSQELKDLAVNAATWFKLVLDVDLIDHECSQVLNTVGLLADGTTALSWNVQQFDHWFKRRIEVLDDFTLTVKDPGAPGYPYLLQQEAVGHHLSTNWQAEEWTMQSALEACRNRIAPKVETSHELDAVTDGDESAPPASVADKALSEFDLLAVVSAQRYMSNKEGSTSALNAEMESLRERRLQFQESMAERQAMQAKRAKKGLRGMWENAQLWLRDNAARHFNEFPLLLGSVRKIEGYFGSGVGSYFRFLRWIMLLNLVLGFIAFGLLIYPQMMDSTEGNINPVTDITPGALLTGKGLEKTWVFYGGYKSETTFLDGKYDMALAYALSVAVMFLFSMATIVDRIFIERGRTSSGTSCAVYTPTLISQQDFSVTSQSTQSTLTKGCAQQLRIHIADEHTAAHAQATRASCQDMTIFILRRTTGFLIASSVFVGAVYINVWVLSNGDELGKSFPFAVPLLLVSVKQGLPIFVILSVWIEDRVNIEDVLQVTMLRVYCFKLFSLLVWFWEMRNQVLDGSLVKDKQDACVETEVAKIFYEAMLMDMFVVSGTCVVSSFALKKVNSIRGCDELQVFDHNVVGDCVIDLMYRQAMIWSGAILCPILCLWGFLMNLVIFMVQCNTFVVTHGPPSQPWGASDSNKFFLYLLLCTLVIAAVPAAQFYNDPKECGAFVSVANPLQSFNDVIRASDGLNEVLKYATNKWVLSSILLASFLFSRLLHSDLQSTERELKKIRGQCDIEKEEKESLIRRFCEAGMTKEELGRNRKNIDLVEDMLKT